MPKGAAPLSFQEEERKTIMARTNKKRSEVPYTGPVTHEGAPAKVIDTMAQLRRSVLSCLLGENEFYEDGVEIKTRIRELALKVDPVALSRLAIEARHRFHLRHVPLLLLCVLAETGRGPKLAKDETHHRLPLPLLRETVAAVISRADEGPELVAMYWQMYGRKMLPNGMRKGIADALRRFDTFQLSRYDSKGKTVALRDVLFLSHAKPADAPGGRTGKATREAIAPRTPGEVRFDQLANDTLPTEDSWEQALMAGKDKKETFERLIGEGKLGYLALLRNLRNMEQAGCDRALVSEAIIARKGGAHRVWPFRYVAAMRAAPGFTAALDKALLAAIGDMASLPGTTVVLVDVSSSMGAKLSGKSDLTRMDAAATLGAIVPGDIRLFTFSNDVKEVPAHRGLAGIETIVKSQPHSGTYMVKAVDAVNAKVKRYDRIIVVSDEQIAHENKAVTPLPGAKAYMINVASAKNGIGYGKPWVHLDGFSESVLTFIREHEAEGAQ